MEKQKEEVEIHGGFERIHIRQAIEEFEEKLRKINGGNGFDITDSKEENMDKKTKSKEIWLFLDEFNTSPDIGWFTELICNHSLDGVKLSNEIKIIAALKFYIWQFGSLSNLDEQQYILEMTKNWKQHLHQNIHKIFEKGVNRIAKQICKSQDF
ncbi:hypothetical protein RFI_37507, partial [Reticulomyxa filosa]